MGMALSDQGSIAEAVASYQRALTLKPDFAEACSNLALCLNYRKEVTATELFAAHRDWHRRFGRLVPISTTYNKRKPERRLKVGYVSPNFREHSVAFFIEPLLREHDREVVEVHCYAEVARPDAVTARLQAYSDHWLALYGYQTTIWPSASGPTASISWSIWRVTQGTTGCGYLPASRRRCR
jgi:predicted O-linked N-acetylglucosamine transferase (SPINDLY family)